jgi:hypothetical protein
MITRLPDNHSFMTDEAKKLVEFYNYFLGMVSSRLKTSPNFEIILFEKSDLDVLILSSFMKSKGMAGISAIYIKEQGIELSGDCIDVKEAYLTMKLITDNHAIYNEFAAAYRAEFEINKHSLYECQFKLHKMFNLDIDLWDQSASTVQLRGENFCIPSQLTGSKLLTNYYCRTTRKYPIFGKLTGQSEKYICLPADFVQTSMDDQGFRNLEMMMLSLQDTFNKKNKFYSVNFESESLSIAFKKTNIVLSLPVSELLDVNQEQLKLERVGSFIAFLMRNHEFLPHKFNAKSIEINCDFASRDLFAFLNPKKKADAKRGTSIISVDIACMLEIDSHEFTKRLAELEDLAVIFELSIALVKRLNQLVKPGLIRMKITKTQCVLESDSRVVQLYLHELLNHMCPDIEVIKNKYSITFAALRGLQSNSDALASVEALSGKMLQNSSRIVVLEGKYGKVATHAVLSQCNGDLDGTVKLLEARAEDQRKLQEVMLGAIDVFKCLLQPLVPVKCWNVIDDHLVLTNADQRTIKILQFLDLPGLCQQPVETPALQIACSDIVAFAASHAAICKDLSDHVEKLKILENMIIRIRKKVSGDNIFHSEGLVFAYRSPTHKQHFLSACAGLDIFFPVTNKMDTFVVSYTAAKLPRLSVHALSERAKQLDTLLAAPKVGMVPVVAHTKKIAKVDDKPVNHAPLVAAMARKPLAAKNKNKKTGGLSTKPAASVSAKSSDKQSANRKLVTRKNSLEKLPPVDPMTFIDQSKINPDQLDWSKPLEAVGRGARGFLSLIPEHENAHEGALKAETDFILFALECERVLRKSGEADQDFMRIFHLSNRYSLVRLLNALDLCAQANPAHQDGIVDNVKLASKLRSVVLHNDPSDNSVTAVCEQLNKDNLQVSILSSLANNESKQPICLTQFTHGFFKKDPCSIRELIERTFADLTMLIEKYDNNDAKIHQLQAMVANKVTSGILGKVDMYSLEIKAIASCLVRLGDLFNRLPVLDVHAVSKQVHAFLLECYALRSVGSHNNVFQLANLFDALELDTVLKLGRKGKEVWLSQCAPELSFCGK